MPPDSHDVAILGVGSAHPATTARIAQAINLPVETMVDAVYRAPMRIATALMSAQAQQLAASLSEMGLDVAVLPAGAPMPRPPLLDVAAEIIDLGAADRVAEALGAFLGVSAGAAQDILLTPPGLILGGVTAATLKALSEALPAGSVCLTSAEPANSRFALFAGPLVHAQCAALSGLVPDDACFGPDGSVTAFGLTFAQAEAVWRTLRASERVRLGPVDVHFNRMTVAAREMRAV